ncbi:aldo/keto reductase [Streptomyces inhibens]|uniref:aldo/keto reductase n=1 Tax=Streptomyces inhibens TaxID=2293571 RepID=UPI001EE6A9F5|nr:aldo/keto reductase [Streptomyces inhibens]UKY51779.1 aldo/keto reductase [Streptomyces inhibens]
MEHRRLGRSGLHVSAVTIGSAMAAGHIDYRSGTAATEGDAPDRFVRAVHRALDAGITTFDTASAYGAGRAEELLGRAVRGARRDGLELITKVYFPTGPGPNERGLSRKHLFASLHGSLRRLGTDHVDLYLAHRYDDQVPLTETMQAFADLVRGGKALYIGVSGWSAEQVAAAAELAGPLGVPLVCAQEVWNLLDRTAEERLAPVCRELGAGLMACSPLAAGVLTGKYRPGRPAPEGSRGAGPGGRKMAAALADEELLARVERLAPLAADAGLTTTGLAVAWVLRRQGVASAVVGVSDPDQLEEIVAAAGAALDEDLMTKIDDVFGH